MPHRSAACEARYRAAREAALRKYATYEDHLRVTCLLDDVRASRTGALRAVRGPRSLERALVRNRFPYADLPRGTTHLVLFSRRSMSLAACGRVARAALPATARVEVAVNAPRDRSVKGLWHCHVFATP